MHEESRIAIPRADQPPLTSKEIGDRMFLSRHTVKTQAISIYGKLGASSRSEAVQRAIEIGLLEPFPGLPRPRGSDVGQ